MSHMSWFSYRVFCFFFFFFLNKNIIFTYSYTFLSALARRYGISINPFSHSKLIYSVSRRAFFSVGAWRGYVVRWIWWSGKLPHIKMKFNSDGKNDDHDEDSKTKKRFAQPVYCLVLNKITGGIVIAYANITFIACKPFQILVECCFLSFLRLPRVDLFSHLHFSPTLAQSLERSTSVLLPPKKQVKNAAWRWRRCEHQRSQHTVRVSFAFSGYSVRL